jgi:CRP-like cAMP-binding protein
MKQSINRVFITTHRTALLVQGLMSEMTDADKRRLMAIIKKRHFRNGEIILADGVVPDEIVVLKNGSANYVRHGQAEVTEKIALDEIVSLTEAISKSPFEGDVRAMTDCDLAVVKVEPLSRFLRRTPAACFRLLEILAESLRHARSELLNEAADQ